MRVSALIATHNRHHVVGEAIDSVLAQTRPAEEIVVVDDGSTDETPRRLAAYGERIRVVRQQNVGIAAARNAALRHATGDWIAFLDDDDIWYPQRLEVLERDLRGAAPEIRVHLANLRYVGPGYEFEQMAMYGLEAPRGRARRVDDIFILAAKGFQLNSLACSRTLALEIGFDERLPTHEDKLFTGLLGNGRPWLVTGDVVSDVRRLAGASLTERSAADSVRRAQCMLSVNDRLLDLELSDRHRRALLGSRHYILLVQARAMMKRGEAAGARRSLLQAARCHPSPAKGWAKVLPPLLLGQRGFRLALARQRRFDR
jgi:glycosyltransferase involved in cell wall biosynthesis